MIEPGPDAVTAETDPASESASAAVQRIDSTGALCGIETLFFASSAPSGVAAIGQAISSG